MLYKMREQIHEIMKELKSIAVPTRGDRQRK